MSFIEIIENHAALIQALSTVGIVTFSFCSVWILCQQNKRTGRLRISAVRQTLIDDTARNGIFFAIDNTDHFPISILELGYITKRDGAEKFAEAQVSIGPITSDGKIATKQLWKLPVEIRPGEPWRQFVPLEGQQPIVILNTIGTYVHTTRETLYIPVANCPVGYRVKLWILRKVCKKWRRRNGPTILTADQTIPG